MNAMVKLVCIALSLIIPASLATAQNAEEIFQRGNSLEFEGKYKEALMYVDSSLRIDSTLYQRYHFRADLKAKLGMTESAIDDITKCILKCKCPTYKYHVSDYYLDRAQLQLLTDNYSAAFADVRKSISFNTNNWKAFNFRSALFIQFGKLQDALLDLDTSIKLNDNEATTFINRGMVKIQMGDIKGACKDLSVVQNWGIDDFDSWLNENCR